MNTSFILMIVSASTLPLLAFLTLLLRRNFVQGKFKIILLAIGTVLLTVTVFNTFTENGEALTLRDTITSIGTGVLTIFILSKFSHGHDHAIEEEGAKGIVISEAFHSLLDGAVIGATYLINPIFGYAATIGIIIHELPKIIGTLTLFRSIGVSVKKTIAYGVLAQIGSPAAAILIYLLGKQINEEQFHALEIASVSSLAAIVLWIIYLEVRFHIRHPQDKIASHAGHDKH
jgi:zinc transporter ZupT